MSYDVLLVSCVFEKAEHPAAARDLYIADRFCWARRYAEQHSSPWFILSGEHALVRPHDWLAPYDTDLNEMSSEYRAAWGRWVVAKLIRDCGGLEGLSVEIHAPQSYLEPIAAHLQASRALVQRPLDGVALDQWPSWYRRWLSRHRKDAWCAH